jgi:hypothetical protein
VVGYADHAVIDTSKLIRHKTGTHHNHRVDGTAVHPKKIATP